MLFLTPILSWLGSLLGGPFATAALKAYEAKLSAGTNADKIKADLAAQIAEIKTQREGLTTQLEIAEQGHWYTAAVRPLFASPFVIYNLKVVVWDKVFGLGVTDPLSAELFRVESILLAGYFGSVAIENAARVLRATGR